MDIGYELRCIVAEHFKLEDSEVTDSLSISKDLKADSLQRVELVMEIERVFQIEIRDEQAAKLDSFEQLVACVTTKLNESSDYSRTKK